MKALLLREPRPLDVSLAGRLMQQQSRSPLLRTSEVLMHRQRPIQQDSEPAISVALFSTQPSSHPHELGLRVSRFSLLQARRRRSESGPHGGGLPALAAAPWRLRVPGRRSTDPSCWYCVRHLATQMPAVQESGLGFKAFASSA